MDRFLAEFGLDFGDIGSGGFVERFKKISGRYTDLMLLGVVLGGRNSNLGFNEIKNRNRSTFKFPAV